MSQTGATGPSDNASVSVDDDTCNLPCLPVLRPFQSVEVQSENRCRASFHRSLNDALSFMSEKKVLHMPDHAKFQSSLLLEMV